MGRLGWARQFEDPIPLPDGRKLVTLKQAGEYITALPKKEHDAPEWQTATEVLIMAAEGRGPMMLARIGMLRALNHGKSISKEPQRKQAKAHRLIR